MVGTVSKSQQKQIYHFFDFGYIFDTSPQGGGGGNASPKQKVEGRHVLYPPIMMVQQ